MTDRIMQSKSRLLEYLENDHDIREYETTVLKCAPDNYAYLTGWYSGMLRDLVLLIGRERLIRLASVYQDLDDKSQKNWTVEEIVESEG